MKNFYSRIVFNRIARKLTGKPVFPATDILASRISLNEARNIRHNRFAVVNNGAFVNNNVPDRLKSGDYLWTLPFDGFDLSIEEHHCGLVYSLRLHLDFESDGNFAALVKGKTQLSEADIRPLIAKEWIALVETERNRLSLNAALEKYGLRCSDLQFNIERDISLCSEAINHAGFVFLPKDSGWECWQDSGQFSITQNRFARREDIEALLPLRVGQEEAKTKKYVVHRNGKKLFFTFGKEVTFGRSRERSIYFPQDKHPAFARISNLHCTLTEKNGKLVLVDSSSNGMECDGTPVGKASELKKTTFLLYFGNVLQLSAKIRNFHQTDFATEWTKAGLPLEAFFALCNQPSSAVAAKSVQFIHDSLLAFPQSGTQFKQDTLNNFVEWNQHNADNPLKDEVYYAVLI